MKNDGALHHILPTEWFIGACENPGCDHSSVSWSEKSQRFLCWECQADAGYKVAAYMFKSE